MRTAAIVALVLGVMAMLLAGMAFFELRAAAMSETAPAVDAMPFTKLVGPELFDPQHAQTKPAILAATVFRRIFLIGAGAILIMVLAVVCLAVNRGKQKEY